jgi:hypothetical protein
LLALTLGGIVLYVVLDVVAQLLPPHYSPIRQAESDLGVGPYGWIMSVNFVLRGILTAGAAILVAAAFPADARPRAAVGCLWAFAVGSALLAFFPTDILDDRRLVPNPVPTAHGDLHLLVAALAFAAAAVGVLWLSLVLPRAEALRAVRTPALVLASLAVLAVVLLRSAGRHHWGGLDERLFLAATLAWLGTVAWTVGRHPTAPASGPRLGAGPI